MTLPPCGRENSILEPELRLAATQDVITSLEILETPHDQAAACTYFVTVQIQWSGEKVWYLTTRRDRDRPRRFRDLSVLVRLLRELTPDTVTLRFSVEPPPAGECVTPARADHSTHDQAKGSAGRA